MDQAAGDRVGEFTLLEAVAHGGSGQVWQASSGTDQTAMVAVKIFDRPTEAAAEAKRLDMARRISGIAELVDQGDGWMATRWVEGRTLAHLIQTEGPLPPDRTARLIRQLAATLDDLHAIGLVHGDLSPSNVIVDLHDQVTLVDLGTPPQSVDDDDADHDVDKTVRVELRATPRYAAPEVAAGDQAEPASDRYALALIAYEALTGQSPFPPVTSSMAMLGHHVSSQPAPVSESAPVLGTRFDSLFERALAKEPPTRHPQAKSFAAELGSPVGRGTSVDPTTDPVFRRSKPVALALLAAAAVAITLIAVTVGSRSDNAASSSEQAIVAPPATATPEPTITPNPTPAGADPSSSWSTGMAAGFSCNLVTLPGFEEERLPNNWYQGDDENAISLAPGAGVDGSTALRVGAGPRYGLVAERVPVTGGERYHFSAWVRRQGEPERSGMWLEYETADNVQIDGIEQELFAQFDELLDDEGRRVTRTFEVPANAMWAVPTFFKDGSTGSILVDEVVFGTASACRDVPT